MDYLAKAKVIDNALGCRRSLEQCFDLLNVQEKTLSFMFFFLIRIAKKKTKEEEEVKSADKKE